MIPPREGRTENVGPGGKKVPNAFPPSFVGSDPTQSAAFITGQPTDELKAITGSWSVRSQEYEVMTHDPETRAILERQKIIRIGYRPIRELQRRLRKSTGQ